MQLVPTHLLLSSRLLNHLHCIMHCKLPSALILKMLILAAGAGVLDRH